MLLDEQFRCAGGGLGRVGDLNERKEHYPDLQNINITKNGYIYVYCSNESPVKVFFDNLQVIHTKGPILEEAHYYPYGLKIAGISSKAAFPMFSNSVPSFGYQGDFSEEANDFGINYNEFMLRNYDAQIGRWTGADPYNEFASPYTGMGNDPVNNVDPDGGSIGYNGLNWLGLAQGTQMSFGQDLLSRAINTAAGALVGGLANSAVNGWNWGNFGKGAAWGGGAGLAATFVPWGDIGKGLESVGKWVRSAFQQKWPYFSSLDAAAYGWGMRYNIPEKREYGSLLYEIEKRGKKVYSFTIPNRSPVNDESGSTVNFPWDKVPKGASVKGSIHSHGAARGNNDDFEFSDATGSQKDDKLFQSLHTNWHHYLTTPSGLLRVIRPGGSNSPYSKKLSNTMPRDKMYKNIIQPIYFGGQEWNIPTINKDLWRGELSPKGLQSMYY